MQKLSEVKVASGRLIRARHESSSTKLPMTFAIFLPRSIDPEPEEGWPVLYWLSGLTCDDTNFSTKAGAFASASREGIAIVLPDTSPRGAGVPGEDEAYDLGTGAGIFVCFSRCARYLIVYSRQVSTSTRRPRPGARITACTLM